MPGITRIQGRTQLTGQGRGGEKFRSAGNAVNANLSNQRTGNRGTPGDEIRCDHHAPCTPDTSGVNRQGLERHTRVIKSLPGAGHCQYRTRQQRLGSRSAGAGAAARRPAGHIL